MSISYEEALATLESMFGSLWTRDSLYVVLQSQKGHIDNTVDLILRHGDQDPQILVDQLQAGINPEDASCALDEQLARQLSQDPSSLQRTAKKGKGTHKTLPNDFLRVPNTAGNSNNVRASAQARNASRAERMGRRKEQTSGPRQRRSAIAKETMEIIERGTYQGPRGAMVSIRDDVAAAVHSTVLYDLNDIPPLPEARFDSRCTIEVTNETTFCAVRRAASDSDDDHHHHVGCLNFASARNLGGGFLRGAQAQEEALARASALYPCLLTQCSGYYEAHRADNNRSLYLDLAIVSPQVPFFRDDNEKLLPQPILCTVITSPAPNAGAFRKSDPKDTDSEIKATLVRRAELILHCAALQKIDTLVLGAWGCGVFGNDPEQVALAFQHWLMEHENQFSRVIFAIPSETDTDENYAAFSNVFRS